MIPALPPGPAGLKFWTYPGPTADSVVNSGLTIFSCDGGSYGLIGQSASFAPSYRLTGFGAALKLGLASAAGAYTLTGSAAPLLRGLGAPAGSYTLTGSDAPLLRTQAAAAGSYTLTGFAASFSTVTVTTLTAAAGSYTLTGSNAPLLQGEVAAAGSYTLTGSSASFVTGAAGLITAAAGSYALTGSSAPLAFRLVAGATETGWTTFTETSPSGEGSGHTGSGTRKIYVSTSGSDSNTGTQASPKATIAGGVALLRDGKPDWLLFKKGDTWTDSFGEIELHGLSATEPMLIGAYGSGARPLFKVAKTDSGMFFQRGGTNGDNIAIVGLDIYSYQNNPSDPGYIATAPNDVNGISSVNPNSWFLVEDCKISFFSTNVSMQNGGMQTLIFNRNVIVDAYDTTARHPQGFFGRGMADLRLIENVFDHNGWNATATDAGPTVFNHNWYVDHDSESDYTGTLTGPVTIIGNISANDSAGCQTRTGGTISKNLFWSDPVEGTNFVDQYQMFFTDNVVSNCPGGVNFITDGHRTGSYQSQCTGNIFLADTGGAAAINFQSTPINITITSNIIFNWDDDFSGTPGTGVTTSGNNIDLAGANNNPGGTAPSEPFSDPTRTVGSYYGSIGGSPATLDGFLTACRAQSKDTWDPRLTATAAINYIRAGFDLAPVVSDAASYTLTGSAASFVTGSTSTTLTAAAGSYTLTGSSANLTTSGSLVLAAAADAYTLTGSSASVGGPIIGYRLTGSDAEFFRPGYWLTGFDATFVTAAAGVTLTAAAGTYTLTGAAAALKLGLVPAAGTYTLTGTAAAFVTGTVFPAAAGSYNLTGSAAPLRRTVAAGAGAYALSGGDIAFQISGALVLLAEPGSYSLTGSDATFQISGIAPPEVTTQPPHSSVPGTRRGGRTRPLYKTLKLKKKKRKEELEELLELVRNLPPLTERITAETAPLLPSVGQTSLLDGVAAPAIIPQLRAAIADEDEDEIALLLEVLEVL